MKQTAVQQLIELLAHNNILDHKALSSDKRLYDLYLRLKAQAEIKEKQQIIHGFDFGFSSGYDDAHGDGARFKDGIQYYNETYGK